jgi:hypothetical protein
MLENIFDHALATRPAPPDFITRGQHRYHVVFDVGDDPLGAKLAQLRADGVKVLDYKKKNFTSQWIVKTMVPRT